MTMKDHERDGTLSEETLNAFVDGQLDAAERARVYAALRADPRLAERACELRELKELVQEAHARPPRPYRPPARGPRWWQMAAAALALVFVGAGAGWMGHRLAAGDGASLAVRAAARTGDRIILHISSGDAGSLRAALDETERLLARAHAEGRPLRIEVVANGKGLDLLRADVSPYAERIRRLTERYDNVVFLACERAIARLRERGVEVRLLPEARTAPSALEQIVTRLQQGWVYIKV